MRKEDRAGLYITVIVHLTVIIVLLLTQIGKELGKENTFVLDFTKQEEMEKAKAQEDFKADISQKIDELLGRAPNYSAAEIKNIAVDRASLKDDRGTDAEQLYKDAERLAQELKMGQDAVKEDARNEAVDLNPTNDSRTSTPTKTYTGPSVVSYVLDGRKASLLKIPAYKCMGGGDVTVIITVNNAGTVVNAKVMESVSSEDSCLRSYAIRAARLSRFSASTTAPANQLGEITYRFIAQ